ncbi:MAG: hypothetical protein K5751_03385 [Treponemataceae bacterium]|nr:hypothetical protein [Treponemataceae bacterium]
MPGMKQLKKFSDDITQLGNELIRRQEKGETFPRVNFPAGISDADDSDDFLFGLPVAGQQPVNSGSGASSVVSGDGSDDDSPVQSVDDILAGISGSSSSGGTEEEFDIEALLAEARGETPKKSQPDSGAAGGIPGSAQGAAAKSVPEFSADNPFTLPGMDTSNASEIPDIDALLSGFADDVETPDININETSGSEPVADDILNNLSAADFGSGNDFSESDFAPDNDFSVGADNSGFEVQSASDDSDPANLFAGLDIPDFGGDSGATGAEPVGADKASSSGETGSADAGTSEAIDADDFLSGVADLGTSGSAGTDDFSFRDDLFNGTGSADIGGSDTGDFLAGEKSADSLGADSGDFLSGADGTASAGVPDSDLSGLAGASGAETANAPGAGSSDASGSDFDFSMPDFDAPSDFDISQDSNASPDSSDFELSDTGTAPSFETDIGGADSTTISETGANGSSADSSGDFDFDLPDFDMPSSEASEAPSGDFATAPGSDADSSFGSDSDFGLGTGSSSIDDDDLFATPAASSGSSSGGLSLSIDSEPESGSFELPPMDDPFSMPEGDGFNPEESSFNPEEAASFEMPEAPDFGDMSEFSMDAPDSGSMEGSFESIDNDNDFSIPGFSGDSDFDLIPPEIPDVKAQKSIKTETKQGRKRKEKVVRERNELSEEEYKTFKENLKGYPLNLRIALQEIIVNPDFTDETIMKIIDMVLSRTPARTLANYLEKESLVDYAIPVPANFEKRTVSEYEEYKKSLEYRLKNRIIPIAIVSVISMLFIGLFSFLIARFVVRPVKAEMLYKEGYTLIENGLYPQSEVKFNEAVYYKAKKSWFYKFARSYSDHKQYERAGAMYERLVHQYDYEKKAGLEYARMELDELSDYAKAEEITRRYVLDHHINNADGMLLLGDIFLEWATNNDSSKFEDARVAYADLMSIYGQTDQYLSRMMRYFIRTDQIREVLPLKSYFYPQIEKDVLEGQDLVELSGYLLDKLFGYLTPADEYLRSSIEDVRDLLEQAVFKAPEIPESTYNLGRYFVETDNTEAAVAVLEESLGVFAAAEKKTHPRILRNINAYRLIGELKTDDQLYLEAERMYVSGIDMFTSEQKRSGLASDENVGILYSDLADLDYFISGDFDSALLNYQYSVDNHNDTPSIRYKMGYINYVNGNTGEALDSFIKTITDQPSERNTLFALGNTLVMRDSTSAAQGYYEKLIDLLDREKETAGVLYPQLREEQGALVEMYMKTANNLGVTLSRLAKRNSNSMYNARAMSLLTESTRAWDALTRNQATMIRLEGTNLAAQNLKYLTVPNSPYEPEIYTAIPRVLYGEKMLSQPEFE